MPLQNGSRIYQLQGLRPKTCYEVKISYPASIPASFSLELKRGESELLPKHPTKLLNTEKLIFKNDDAELQNDQLVVIFIIRLLDGIQNLKPVLKQVCCNLFHR
ncbi:hypothetical protein HanRHA438_Chr12g0573841 [Helianthus annuus]|nr:hypothetical protein HanRHA438_Chr12g0573841 [Helianthus annuus]